MEDQAGRPDPDRTIPPGEVDLRAGADGPAGPDSPDVPAGPDSPGTPEGPGQPDEAEGAEGPDGARSRRGGRTRMADGLTSRLRSKAKAEAAAAAALETSVANQHPHAWDPSAAAFFDVDNTLLAGASIFYFARGLAARDFFHTRDLLRFGWQHVTYRFSGQENTEGMSDVKDAALAFVAGRGVAEIVRYGEEIYDERMAERIISGSRAIAEQHLEAGLQVWLVTATPVELASIIARRLGLTGALGTVSEIVDGLYTGRLVGDPLHGPAKAAAVRALAAREGLDLGKCYAYSDSVNDEPMLSLVGHPTAINPDPDLKALAKANDWPIRDFRTARKAARIGIPTAAGVGAVAGGVAAGVALRRRYAT